MIKLCTSEIIIGMDHIKDDKKPVPLLFKFHGKKDEKPFLEQALFCLTYTKCHVLYGQDEQYMELSDNHLIAKLVSEVDSNLNMSSDRLIEWANNEVKTNPFEYIHFLKVKSKRSMISKISYTPYKDLHFDFYPEGFPDYNFGDLKEDSAGFCAFYMTTYFLHYLLRKRNADNRYKTALMRSALKCHEIMNEGRLTNSRKAFSHTLRTCYFQWVNLYPEIPDTLKFMSQY